MNPTVQYTVYSVQSDFSESNQLCTMNVRSHINSVKSLYEVTPTPYHECMQLFQTILLLNCIKVT